MKVAVATWNERISPVFDVARQVLMLEVQHNRVVARYEATLPGTEPQAQAARLAVLAPRILICGAISQLLAGLVAARRIKVVPFTAGAVEEVIAAWLAGALPNPALAMPGCCGQRRRGHGGRAWRRNRRAWLCKQEMV